MKKFKSELEEFLYIVSHDFGSPLRHIKEFTKLLLDSIGDKIEPQEKKFAGFIEESVKESERMLAALLRYSRLNTIERKSEKIEVCKLIREVLAEEIVYESKDKNIKLDLDCEKDLMIVADRTLIKTLIEELVNNAVKFHNLQAATEIEIKARTENGNFMFAIKDNGIGHIPENMNDEIFAVFRKMNGKNYEGSGIGLTLCRRICEIYRGRVWLEKSDNSGSEFRFSLPLE